VNIVPATPVSPPEATPPVASPDAEPGTNA
jgi:hypothetical protein